MERSVGGEGNGYDKQEGNELSWPYISNNGSDNCMYKNKGNENKGNENKGVSNNENPCGASYASSSFEFQKDGKIVPKDNTSSRQYVNNGMLGKLPSRVIPEKWAVIKRE